MFDALPTSKYKWVHSMIALQIPKTGSTSLSSVIGQRNLIQKHKQLFINKFQNHPLYRGTFDTRHAVPAHVYEVFSDKVRGFFSFAVKREPFSRIESAFAFGKKKKFGGLYGLKDDCSFEDFVNFLFERWQQNAQDILILKRETEWTHSSYFHPNRILSFENLSVDWRKMLEDYHIEGLPIELPRENVSDRASINFSWTPELRDKVYKIYEPDFDLLGYSYKY